MDTWRISEFIDRHNSTRHIGDGGGVSINIYGDIRKVKRNPIIEDFSARLDYRYPLYNRRSSAYFTVLNASLRSKLRDRAFFDRTP